MAKTKNSSLCTVDILEKLHHADNIPWAAPYFYQIKKTGDPCFLTAFREVNKCIQRTPFPLPQINVS